MIFLITGNVGAGKSLSVTRMIRKRSITERGKFHIPMSNKVFTNFHVKIPGVTRLKKSDIVIPVVVNDEITGKKKKQYGVNWPFWKEQQVKHKNITIILDEVQNLFPARSSMTRFSIAGTKWISQVRKMTSSSKDSHCILLTQEPEALDVAWRRKIHCGIMCEPKPQGRTFIVKQRFFFGKSANILGRMEMAENGYKTWNYSDAFIGNPYFNLYDTYEILGEDEYL